MRFKRKIRRDYQAMLDTLDRILAGEQIEERFDESLDAAIVDRLKRIMEMVYVNKEKAEEERDTVKSLISDISHQIRMPLTNISLYSELLQENLTDEKDRKLANTISRNAETLSFHMKALMKASYSEQDLISVQAERTSLLPIIEGACQRMDGELFSKKISLDKKVANETIHGDPKWSEEALFNVLDNACKYSETGSRISIETKIYESFVCVEVKDSGIGIPEGELGKVCQRFSRGSNVSEEKGIGIGLYLTREVLNREQGYMKIKSKLGEGTCVSLFFLKAN